MKHTPSARTWRGESCAAEQDRWEQEGVRVDLQPTFLPDEAFVGNSVSVPVDQLPDDQAELCDPGEVYVGRWPLWLVIGSAFLSLTIITAAGIVLHSLVRGVMCGEWRCP